MGTRSPSSGRIAYLKVLGEKNPADLITKHLGAEVIGRHVDTLNMIWIEGRAESAPTLDSIETYIQTWGEDGAYFDESSDDGDFDTDLSKVEEEQKGERKKVARGVDHGTEHSLGREGQGHARQGRKRG